MQAGPVGPSFMHTSRAVCNAGPSFMQPGRAGPSLIHNHNDIEIVGHVLTSNLTNDSNVAKRHNSFIRLVNNL
jgi:hypothetical protein